MPAIGLAEMNISPIQKKRTDPIRQTPEQRNRYDKICIDSAIRILQPLIKRSGCSVELFCHRFSGFTILLHQHIKSAQERIGKIPLILQLRFNLIQFLFIDEILQIKHCLLHVIRIVVHSPEDVFADVFLLIYPRKAKAALIYTLDSPRRQHMPERGLLNKSRLVSHDMAIGIDESTAIQHLPKIGILFIQMSGRDMADIEGVFRRNQRNVNGLCAR